MTKETRHCALCTLPSRLCYCAQIPSIPTKTRISLILHTGEKNRLSNTGQLAARCLPNSEVRIFGDRTDWREWPDLKKSGHRPVILVPRSNVVLSEPWAKESELPIQLIIPDGNWHQANSMARKLIAHYQLPTVRLPLMAPSHYLLRREHNENNGVSTIEAIAAALGLLGNLEAEVRLQAIFRLMVERRLSLKKAPSYEKTYTPEKGLLSQKE